MTHRVFAATAAAVVSILLQPTATAVQPNASTLIRNVMVFDGNQKSRSPVNVLIAGDAIVRVTADALAADGREVVDGKGRVLMPGLIDSHMHSSGNPNAFRQQALFGVTSSVGMWGAAPAEEKLLSIPEIRAVYKTAARGATVPGGHGDEERRSPVTVSDASDADAFVEARFTQGSDFLKIILGPPNLPMLSEATTKALIDAAHKRGRMAVAHVDGLKEAKMAVRLGIDALVHVFCDAAADDPLIRDMVSRRVFLVPTLTIRQGRIEAAWPWRGNAQSLLDNQAIAPMLSAEERRKISETTEGNSDCRQIAATNVARFNKAGVIVLAGSDAANPGTAWGASLHQELQLLVGAGLSPHAVLHAATAAPAERFGWTDRGRIAPGLRADLLLLECDPTSDIRCTARIGAVWQGGRRIERVAAGH